MPRALEIIGVLAALFFFVALLVDGLRSLVGTEPQPPLTVGTISLYAGEAVIVQKPTWERWENIRLHVNDVFEHHGLWCSPRTDEKSEMERCYAELRNFFDPQDGRRFDPERFLVRQVTISADTSEGRRRADFVVTE